MYKFRIIQGRAKLFSTTLTLGDIFDDFWIIDSEFHASLHAGNRFVKDIPLNWVFI